MSLIIDDPKIDELVRKLTSLTGETATEAVTAALAGRLRRLEKTQNVDVILEDVRRISAQFRAQIKEPMTSVDHDEVLHDDSGLPK
jgi:hypothetical protein